jgi:hypothetical protein
MEEILYEANEAMVANEETDEGEENGGFDADVTSDYVDDNEEDEEDEDDDVNACVSF